MAVSSGDHPQALHELSPAQANAVCRSLVVIFRLQHIGEDEVAAIAPCHAFLAAAKSGAADASDEAAFRGYHFRSLPTSSGMGFIAFPAAYGLSGVMTFVIGADDSVRQKDLGANTAQVASGISGAQVDATWVAVASTAL